MNWHEIISRRTPVKTKDNTGCGYVAGEYKDNLLVISGKLVSKEYVIPKTNVDKYDGKQLSLNIRSDQISPEFKL
jgi:hypothetical protein